MIAEQEDAFVFRLRHSSAQVAVHFMLIHLDLYRVCSRYYCREVIFFQRQGLWRGELDPSLCRYCGTIDFLWRGTINLFIHGDVVGLKQYE